MNRNFRSASLPLSQREKPFDPIAFEWISARFRDVMIAAEVLHQVQFAAPWLDCRSLTSRGDR